MICFSLFCIFSNILKSKVYFRLTEDDWTKFGHVYRRSRIAQTFLSSYNYDDVGVVQLSPHSTSTWTISPPDEENLKIEAKSRNVRLTMSVLLSSLFTHLMDTASWRFSFQAIKPLIKLCSHIKHFQSVFHDTFLNYHKNSLVWPSMVNFIFFLRGINNKTWKNKQKILQCL